MDTLPIVPAASNAAPAPSPVRRKAPSRPRNRRKAAYEACREHPAYRDAKQIVEQIVILEGLCEQFTESYQPDTIAVYLRNLELAHRDLSEEFDSVHRDIRGAVWLLEALRGMIDPSLMLPIDLTATSAAQGEKGGAA